MGKLNNVMLTVSDVTGWHYKHVATLTGWINAYANLLGHNQEEKAVQAIRIAMALERDFPTYNLNHWMNTVIRLIFHELVSILGQNERTVSSKALRAMQTKLVPKTDDDTSRFGNCFDQIDFEQDRQAIIGSAVKLIESL